jgi:hypothetical protein
MLQDAEYSDTEKAPGLHWVTTWCRNVPLLARPESRYRENRATIRSGWDETESNRALGIVHIEVHHDYGLPRSKRRAAPDHR